MEPIVLFMMFVLGAMFGMILTGRKPYADTKNQLEILAPQIFNLAEGSIVALRAPGAISTENAERLKKQWETNFPGVKCIVLGDGISVNCVMDPAK